MILVTGVTGYLGSEIARQGGAKVAGTSPSSDGVDIRDRAAVSGLVSRVAPEVIIHTAYRQNDEDARAINVDGSETVAAAARASGARLIHISSDLVFRGGLGRALTEEDPVDPVTDYGRTKADAERAVRAAHPSALIARTSLIYRGPGDNGRSSNHELLALEAARGEREVGFFANEVRSPVQVGDLAAALLQLARLDLSGLLHIAGADAVNRYEFAQLIAAAYGESGDGLRATQSPPDRPSDCALDSTRARAALGLRLRGVREVLG